MPTIWLVLLPIVLLASAPLGMTLEHHERKIQHVKTLVAQAQQHIATEERELKELQARLHQLAIDTTARTNELTELRAAFETSEDDRAVLQPKMNAAATEIEVYNKRTKQLEATRDQRRPTIDSLHERVSELTAELQRLEKELRPTQPSDEL